MQHQDPISDDAINTNPKRVVMAVKSSAMASKKIVKDKAPLVSNANTREVIVIEDDILPDVHKSVVGDEKRYTVIFYSETEEDCKGFYAKMYDETENEGNSSKRKIVNPDSPTDSKKFKSRDEGITEIFIISDDEDKMFFEDFDKDSDISDDSFDDSDGPSNSPDDLSNVPDESSDESEILHSSDGEDTDPTEDTRDGGIHKLNDYTNKGFQMDPLSLEFTPSFVGEVDDDGKESVGDCVSSNEEMSEDDEENEDDIDFISDPELSGSDEESFFKTDTSGQKLALYSTQFATIIMKLKRHPTIVRKLSRSIDVEVKMFNMELCFRHILKKTSNKIDTMQKMTTDIHSIRVQWGIGMEHHNTEYFDNFKGLVDAKNTTSILLNMRNLVDDIQKLSDKVLHDK